MTSAPYDALLIDMLKDKERALAYLNAALDEPDQRIFWIALRNVAKAHGGLASIALRSGLNRESLYRALSERGNPSVQTLTAVLGALGTRLGIEKLRRSDAHNPLGSFPVMGGVRPRLAWADTPALPVMQLAAA